MHPTGPRLVVLPAHARDAATSLADAHLRAGRHKVVAPMSRDRRPCKGDAFVKAGPRLRREDCENCENYRRRGGKCLGRRGWEVARVAGVVMEAADA